MRNRTVVIIVTLVVALLLLLVNAGAVPPIKLKTFTKPNSTSAPQLLKGNIMKPKDPNIMLENLLQWLDASGVNITRARSIVEMRVVPGSGRGMFAKTFIPAGTPILRQPLLMQNASHPLTIIHAGETRKAIAAWLKHDKKLLERLLSEQSNALFLLVDRYWIPVLLNYRNQKKHNLTFDQRCLTHPIITLGSLEPYYSKPGQEVSFWQPFYDIFPSSLKEMSTFVFTWSDRDEKEAQKTSLKRTIQNAKANMKYEWENTFSPILQDLKKYFEEAVMQLQHEETCMRKMFELPQISFEDFAVSRLIDQSRSFHPFAARLPQEYHQTTVLIPYCDFFNTDPESNRNNVLDETVMYNGDLYYSWVTTRDIQAGEELLYTYHVSSTNDHWLEHYGLCRNVTKRNNPADKVLLHDEVVKVIENRIGSKISDPQNSDPRIQILRSQKLLDLFTRGNFMISPLLTSDILTPSVQLVSSNWLEALRIVNLPPTIQPEVVANNTKVSDPNLDKGACSLLHESLIEKFTDLCSETSLEKDMEILQRIEKKLAQKPSAKLYKKFCIVSHRLHEKRVVRQWLNVLEACILA